MLLPEVSPRAVPLRQDGGEGTEVVRISRWVEPVLGVGRRRGGAEVRRHEEHRQDLHAVPRRIGNVPIRRREVVEPRGKLDARPGEDIAHDAHVCSDEGIERTRTKVRIRKNVIRRVYADEYAGPPESWMTTRGGRRDIGRRGGSRHFVQAGASRGARAHAGLGTSRGSGRCKSGADRQEDYARGEQRVDNAATGQAASLARARRSGRSQRMTRAGHGRLSDWRP